jgi:hypothetical protein
VSLRYRECKYSRSSQNHPKTFYTYRVALALKDIALHILPNLSSYRASLLAALLLAQSRAYEHSQCFKWLLENILNHQT